METGTIRRVDELGRIVLPKGIRQKLRIKSGDNIEIYIENNNIILKKYSELDRIKKVGQDIADTLKETLKAEILITDTDKIIVVSGKKYKNYLDKEINEELIKKINKRQTIIDNKIILVEDEIPEYNIVNPLIINGDIIGSIIVISDSKIDEFKTKAVSMLSSMLIKNIE